MEAEDRKAPCTRKKDEVTKYEYAGYQIRIHFTGEKTLAQCMKNLIERRIGE